MPINNHLNLLNSIYNLNLNNIPNVKKKKDAFMLLKTNSKTVDDDWVRSSSDEDEDVNLDPRSLYKMIYHTHNKITTEVVLHFDFTNVAFEPSSSNVEEHRPVKVVKKVIQIQKIHFSRHRPPPLAARRTPHGFYHAL